MAQYIDKDALVADIKRISCENPMDNSWYVDTEELLDFLDTLEVKEVNLESLVRQVIDLYLEAGEHYNSVIKEEREENGGSDLVIKLLDGVIDAKELGIQYVLDKLKAQKGEEA